MLVAVTVMFCQKMMVDAIRWSLMPQDNGRCHKIMVDAGDTASMLFRVSVTGYLMLVILLQCWFRFLLQATWCWWYCVNAGSCFCYRLPDAGDTASMLVHVSVSGYLMLVILPQCCFMFLLQATWCWWYCFNAVSCFCYRLPDAGDTASMLFHVSVTGYLMLVMLLQCCFMFLFQAT